MDRVIALKRRAATLKRRQNLKIGINRLPTEIIIHILQYVIELSATRHLITLPIFRFSSRFRDIALSSPSLWNTINSPLNKVNQELLRRSQGCLLDIPDLTGPLVDLVVPHMARWRLLSYTQEVGESLDWLYTGEAPELSDLSLVVYPSNTPLALFNGITPKLRRLQTNCLFPFDDGTFARLQYLKLTDVRFTQQDFLGWLPKQNDLRSLTVHTSERLQGSVRLHFVTYFQKLESLDLRGGIANAFLPIIPFMPSCPTFYLRLSSIDSIQSLQDVFIMPSVIPPFPNSQPLLCLCTSISIYMQHLSGSHPVRGSLIISFSWDSMLYLWNYLKLGCFTFPSLQVLELDDTHPSTATVIPLLEAAPSLRTLKIKRFRFNIPLLNRLSTSTPSILLPNLKHLEINPFQSFAPVDPTLAPLAAVTLNCLVHRSRMQCSALDYLSVPIALDEEMIVMELRGYTKEFSAACAEYM